MKTFNIKEVATLLKEKRYTKKSPLRINPTYIHYWYDSRHYSDDIDFGPFVALWQEHGCVWGKNQEGFEEKIQKKLMFCEETNYWNSETPSKNQLLNIINNANNQ